MYVITSPALLAGSWTVNTESDREYDVSVTCLSVESLDFDSSTTAVGVGDKLLVTVTFPGLVPATAPGGPGEPGLGTTVVYTASDIAAPWDGETLEFYLVKADGTGKTPLTLYDDGLHNDGLPNDGTFGGETTFTDSGDYKLGVTDGGDLVREAKVTLSAGTVSVTREGSEEKVVAPGDSTTYSFTIKNLADTSRTFNISKSSTLGWDDTSAIPRQRDPGRQWLAGRYRDHHRPRRHGQQHLQHLDSGGCRPGRQYGEGFDHRQDHGMVRPRPGILEQVHGFPRRHPDHLRQLLRR